MPLNNVFPSFSKHSLSGEMKDKIHILMLRIYYEDTDFSGIVYHANYLRYLERGRTDFLRLSGMDQSTLYDQGNGTALVVRSMKLDFLKPAVMDDVIRVETRLKDMGRASFLMEQYIYRDDVMLLSAEVQIAALKRGRATRIPAALHELL